jgi:hypothetical protein
VNVADTLVFNEGEYEKLLMIEGVMPGTTTLTATLSDRGQASVEVTVLDANVQPSQITANPSEVSMGINSTVDITLTFDVPTPNAYSLTVISNDLDQIIDLPNQIDVPQGVFTTQVSLVALDQAGEGSFTLSAGDAQTTVSVAVTEVPQGGSLVINEVDYDQPGQDDAEFIEIYNPTSQPIDLTSVSLELLNGLSGGQVYHTLPLSSVASELPANAFLVLF